MPGMLTRRIQNSAAWTPPPSRSARFTSLEMYPWVRTRKADRDFDAKGRVVDPYLESQFPRLYKVEASQAPSTCALAARRAVETTQREHGLRATCHARLPPRKSRKLKIRAEHRRWETMPAVLCFQPHVLDQSLKRPRLFFLSSPINRVLSR